MKKQSDLKNNINNLGQGILEKLENESKSNRVEDEKSITEINLEDKKSNVVNTENSKSKKDENDKILNKQNNNNIKEGKSKRSFMLSDTAIQRLNLLKLVSQGKDLSELVEEGINRVFEENKNNIDKLINIYNKIK